jgi:hypothetical protein
MGILRVARTRASDAHRPGGPPGVAPMDGPRSRIPNAPSDQRFAGSGARLSSNIYADYAYLEEVVDGVCVCGHARSAYQHYRSGTDCALCSTGDCKRYRPKGAGARARWWMSPFSRRTR